MPQVCALTYRNTINVSLILYSVFLYIYESNVVTIQLRHKFSFGEGEKRETKVEEEEKEEFIGNAFIFEMANRNNFDGTDKCEKLLKKSKFDLFTLHFTSFSDSVEFHQIVILFLSRN